jgi:SAM-dependent methyltransferase
MTHYTKQFDAEAPLALRSLKKKLRKAEQLSPTALTSILDIGCGNGLYLKAAQQLGLKAVGLDVDKTHIMFAKSKRLCAYHTKIEDFSYSGYFDFVHVKAVLHLVRNPVSLLNHANQLLAENGILYVDASNQEGLFATIRRFFFANPKRFGQILPPLHNMAYTRRSFLTLLDKIGLEPIHLFNFSSGDEIYYPTLKKRTGELLLRFADFIGKGSLIGSYCKKSPLVAHSDCELIK